MIRSLTSDNIFVENDINGNIVNLNKYKIETDNIIDSLKLTYLNENINNYEKNNKINSLKKLILNLIIPIKNRKPKNIIRELKRNESFSDYLLINKIDNNTVYEIAKNITLKKLSKGSYLYKQGSFNDSFYGIICGKMDITEYVKNTSLIKNKKRLITNEDAYNKNLNDSLNNIEIKNNVFKEIKYDYKIKNNTCKLSKSKSFDYSNDVIYTNINKKKKVYLNVIKNMVTSNVLYNEINNNKKKSIDINNKNNYYKQKVLKSYVRKNNLSLNLDVDFDINIGLVCNKAFSNIKKKQKYSQKKLKYLNSKKYFNIRQSLTSSYGINNEYKITNKQLHKQNIKHNINYYDNLLYTEVVKDTIYPGICFGEKEILLNICRKNNIKAKEDCILWELSKELFNKLLRNLYLKVKEDKKNFIKHYLLNSEKNLNIKSFNQFFENINLVKFPLNKIVYYENQLFNQKPLCFDYTNNLYNNKNNLIKYSLNDNLHFYLIYKGSCVVLKNIKNKNSSNIDSNNAGIMSLSRLLIKSVGNTVGTEVIEYYQDRKLFLKNFISNTQSKKVVNNSYNYTIKIQSPKCYMFKIPLSNIPYDIEKIILNFLNLTIEKEEQYLLRKIKLVSNNINRLNKLLEVDNINVNNNYSNKNNNILFNNTRTQSNNLEYNKNNKYSNTSKKYIYLNNFKKSKNYFNISNNNFNKPIDNYVITSTINKKVGSINKEKLSIIRSIHTIKPEDNKVKKNKANYCNSNDVKSKMSFNTNSKNYKQKYDFINIDKTYININNPLIIKNDNNLHIKNNNYDVKLNTTNIDINNLIKNSNLLISNRSFKNIKYESLKSKNSCKKVCLNNNKSKCLKYISCKLSDSKENNFYNNAFDLKIINLSKVPRPRTANNKYASVLKDKLYFISHNKLINGLKDIHKNQLIINSNLSEYQNKIAINLLNKLINKSFFKKNKEDIIEIINKLKNGNISDFNNILSKTKKEDETKIIDDIEFSTEYSNFLKNIVQSVLILNKSNIFIKDVSSNIKESLKKRNNNFNYKNAKSCFKFNILDIDKSRTNITQKSKNNNYITNNKINNLLASQIFINNNSKIINKSGTVDFFKLSKVYTNINDKAYKEATNKNNVNEFSFKKGYSNIKNYSTTYKIKTRPYTAKQNKNI